MTDLPNMIAECSMIKKLIFSMIFTDLPSWNCYQQEIQQNIIYVQGFLEPVTNRIITRQNKKFKKSKSHVSPPVVFPEALGAWAKEEVSPGCPFSPGREGERPRGSGRQKTCWITKCLKIYPVR